MAQIQPSSSALVVDVASTWRKDSLFFLLLLLTLLAFSYVLFADIWQTATTSGKPVAKLSYRDRRVERKIGGQVLWSQIDAPDDIYNYDSIRTEEYSQARLSLDNDTELVLSGSSLVTIVIDAEKLSLDLAQGDLALNTSAESAPVEIKTASGTLQIQDGGGAASISVQEDSIEVDVQQGEVVFVDSDDSDAEQIVVAEKQQLVQDDSGELTVQENPFQVISPAPASLQLVFADSVPVEFGWVAANFAATALEVANTKDFSAGFQSYALEDSTTEGTAQAQQVKLDAGTWFWRIRNDRQESPTATFRLIRDQQPEPLIPEAEAVFPAYEGKSPLIRLQWQRAKHAAFYNVKLFQAEEPEQAFRTITAQSSFISVANLQPGEYLWQVEGIFLAFQKRVSGGKQAFSIQQLALENLPKPKIKMQSTEISQYALKHKGSAIVTWDQVGELDSYLAEVTDSADQTLLQEVVKRSYFELPTDLQQGTYQLRIVALRDGEEVTSQVRTFEVKGLSPIKWITPLRNSRYFSADPQIHLRWQDDNQGSRYLVEVSLQNDFRSILFSQQTAHTFLAIPMLDLGKYYSRISLLDTSGQALLSSASQAFQVALRLQQAPQLLLPTPGASINLTVSGQLRFVWKSVDNATFYRLAITPQVAPKRAITWNVSGLSKEYTDVGNLPLGRYSCTLTAFGKNKGQEIPISEVTRTQFVLQRSKLQKVKRIEIF